VSLQQTVLPRNHPLFPDFEPALDTHGVLKVGKEPGSDSYDAFELPSGRIAMVISGGTGKGLPAVILVTQIRLLIRLLAELGLLPHEILRRANRILARTASQLQQASVTLLFVDYDPITGVVRMASAGHPAPIKVSATGLAEQLILPVSVPLAASGTTTYSLVESRLEVGETLILHTTGLSKAVNPGSDFFESDALKSALFTAPAVTSEQLASAILNASGAPGKTHPSDDITLLIARRLGGQVPARIDTGDPLRSVRTLIPAKAEFLGLIAHLVEESGRMAGLGRDATSDLVLATDEVMAKVIEHSPKAGGGHFIHLEFQTTVKGLRVIVTETGATSNLGPAVAAGAGTEVAGAPGLLLAKFSVTALTHEPSGPEGHRTILYQEKRRKPSNNLLP
jgi:anti-sigma regulatory factor (Ser/Thr protein kinase)